MAMEGYTHITLVLDRSGSMNSVRKDAIGGFNAFLEQQRALEGRATLTLIQFNQRVETMYEARPLDEVPKLDAAGYVVDGFTALLDAVGTALVDTRRFIQALPSESAPHDVVIAILTDGNENSSRTYKAADISSLIADLTQEAGWRVLFLGANIDVWTVGQALGVPRQTTSAYSATGMGTIKAFSDISDFVTLKRPERRLRRRHDDPEDGGSGQVH